MNIKQWLQSPMFIKILCGAGVLVFALAIFQAGIFVGFHKARFSYRFGDNYSRNFAGPLGSFSIRGMMGSGGFTDSHGVTGKILKVSLPTLVIEGADKIEKIVVITDQTEIREFRGDLKPADLKVDDSAVIIGTPNDQGQIEAKLIRILPAPATTNQPAPIK